MSVERRNGRWAARWRDSAGRARSKAFDRKRDAQDFDTRIRQAKQWGGLAPTEAGTQTLSALGAEHFSARRADLAPSTRAVYAVLWNAHVLPRIGGLRITQLAPETIEGFRADLEHAGVGPQSVRKTLVLVQTVLERAVKLGRIPANPARLADKPPAGRHVEPAPLAPAAIERLRAAMAPRDAALVSVLAYGGLRPGEALGLAWGHLGRTLRVERAVAHGEIKAPKTGRPRNVRVVGPLRDDLEGWRALNGGDRDALVFPAGDGGPWKHADWRNWKRRKFDVAAGVAGVAIGRPYDLRHSFVSLLIHEGMSPVEVARQAGHRPSMALDTYGHVFEELEGAERRSAEAEIRAARDSHVY